MSGKRMQTIYAVDRETMETLLLIRIVSTAYLYSTA